jgi:hypothetical protein
VFNLTLAAGSIAVEVSLDALKREGLKMGTNLIQKCRVK